MTNIESFVLVNALCMGFAFLLYAAGRVAGVRREIQQFLHDTFNGKR
jgi:hypothetical protein